MLQRIVKERKKSALRLLMASNIERLSDLVLKSRRYLLNHQTVHAKIKGQSIMMLENKIVSDQKRLKTM